MILQKKKKHYISLNIKKITSKYHVQVSKENDKITSSSYNITTKVFILILKCFTSTT